MPRSLFQLFSLNPGGEFCLAKISMSLKKTKYTETTGSVVLMASLHSLLFIPPHHPRDARDARDMKH